jgi:hypothetical protein
MHDLLESQANAWDEVEFFEAILAADDDLLDEVFDADDVELAVKTAVAETPGIGATGKKGN